MATNPIYFEPDAANNLHTIPPFNLSVGGVTSAKMGVWSGTENYALNNMVTFNGVIYKSLTTNTNKVPNTNPTDWEVYMAPKSNYSAIIAPTVNNDSTEEYEVGSVWVDTVLDAAYVCLDNTATAAVWAKINAGGSFENDAGLISESANSDQYNSDFVIGSPQLTDDGNTNHDKRMFFDKSKGAFRAGRATGTEWDDANVGNYSIAFGSNCIAKGLSMAIGDGSKALEDYCFAGGYHSEARDAEAAFAFGSSCVATGGCAVALGNSTTASGDYSTALGHSTTASGNSSTALGSACLASGYSSVALGESNTASGTSSFTAGETNTASGYTSIALGANCVASGSGSFAAGDGSEASEYVSIALGKNTTASSDYSTALGYSTTASGEGSTASGSGTTAKSYRETVIGSYNTDTTPNSTTSWDAADRIFTIGNGADSSNKSDALTVYKNGQILIGNSYSAPTADNEIAPKKYIDDKGSLGVAGTKVGSWNATETYAADDLVNYSGTFYKALGASLNSQPDTNPADWEIYTKTMVADTITEVTTDNGVQIETIILKDGNLTVPGDLTVSGSTTTIDTTTLLVEDKNIEIGNVATPTDTTADGGGITLKGTTDKTIIWDDANDNFTSSEHLNIPTGKEFKINNASINTAGTLTNVAYQNQANDFGANAQSIDTISESTADAGVTIEGVKNIDGQIQLSEQTTIANPPADNIKIYAKDDGGVTKLYQKISDGTETEIGAGGGLDSAENTDIDTGTETVDTFADTDADACHWHYVVKKGTNLRTGIIMGVWEATGDTVEYNEQTTNDIGDTSDLTFAVDINADQVRLQATTLSDDWSVKVKRIQI